MSLYPFTAWQLTTKEDQRRRPVITADQLARTLVLFALAVVAVAFIASNARAQVVGQRDNNLVRHEADMPSSALPPGSLDAIPPVR